MIERVAWDYGGLQDKEEMVVGNWVEYSEGGIFRSLLAVYALISGVLVMYF